MLDVYSGVSCYALRPGRARKISEMKLIRSSLSFSRCETTSRNVARPAILHPKTAGWNAKRGSDNFFSPCPVSFFFFFIFLPLWFHFIYLFIYLSILLVAVEVKKENSSFRWCAKARWSRRESFDPLNSLGTIRFIGCCGLILLAVGTFTTRGCWLIIAMLFCWSGMVLIFIHLKFLQLFWFWFFDFGFSPSFRACWYRTIAVLRWGSQRSSMFELSETLRWLLIIHLQQSPRWYFLFYLRGNQFFF